MTNPSETDGILILKRYSLVQQKPIFIHTMIILLIFGYLIQLSSQSECIVSQWGTWSECFGGCQKGLIVRNRDVLKPPLPELNSEGKFMQRLCPHLYETRFCDRNECELQNVRYQLKQADLTRNTVEKQMDKIGLASDNINLKSELKRKFISETEQLFNLDNFLNKNENINNVSISPSIDISSRQISNQEYKRQRVMSSTTNKPITSTTTIPSTTTTITTTTKIPSTRPVNLPQIVASSAFRGPRRLKQSSEFSISNLIKKIEQSLDSNQPLDETFIKNSMKRNRKLAKILVDAYRHRFAAKQYELQSTLQSTTTTTGPMQYWPKTGYIPNSRKHASDITSQLYMTNEIVQTMEDDLIPIDVNPDCEQNRRCCQITRNSCSGGEEPRLVKRWYRPKGSSQCVSYDYPRCSMNEEMEELPILFQQNCQDICFGKQEKRISPLFNLQLEDV